MAGKGSKRRLPSDEGTYYLNFDEINWDNRKEEDPDAKARDHMDIYKNPFSNERDKDTK
jgi:hypothetical protein